MSLPRNYWIGISYAVLAKALFAVMTVLISSISKSLPAAEIVFFRNAYAVLWMLPIVYYQGWRQLKPARPGQLVWRSLVGVASMELWFYSLSVLPVNIANALGFTAPLFGTLFAVLFLKETLNRRLVGMLIIGFCGALVILEPWSSTQHWHPFDACIGLLSAAMVAIGAILVKSLTSTEPAWRIVFFSTSLMCLLSIPNAWLHWQEPTWHQTAYTAAIALFAMLGQLSVVCAFARAPVTVILPFNFTGLVFTALLAWIALGEVITRETVIGAIIIIGSSLLVAREESRRQGKLM